MSETNKKVNILIVTHKKVYIPPMPGYQIVIVGGKDIAIEGAVKDNTGENISHKNANYCELTAQYWHWKNGEPDYEYIGLCHYRRFLTKRRFSKSYKYILNTKDIEKSLKRYDIILPEPFVFKISAREIFLQGAGVEKDINRTREIIQNEFSDYLDSFDKILNRNYNSYCNMFIAGKKIYNEYSEWLFAVLGKLEKVTDMTGYTVAEARVFGYISELLLNVWIDKNNLKVKYYPLMEVEIEKNYFLYKLRKRLAAIKNRILY